MLWGHPEQWRGELADLWGCVVSEPVCCFQWADEEFGDCGEVVDKGV